MANKSEAGGAISEETREADRRDSAKQGKAETGSESPRTVDDQTESHRRGVVSRRHRQAFERRDDEPGDERQKHRSQHARCDDEPDAVRNRRAVYQRQTAPVLAWYRQHATRIATLNAIGTPDEVTGRAITALGL